MNCVWMLTLQYIMENTQNTRLSFGKRLKIWIVDVTAVFFFFHLFRFLISYFVFLPFLPSFLIIWLLYYMISFGVWKQTLGTSFFGAYITRTDHKKISWFRIFLREWVTLPGILLIIWYILFYSPVYLVDCSYRLGLLTGRFVILLSLLIIALLRVRVFNIKLVLNTQIDNNWEKQTKKQVFITYSILLLCAAGARYFHTSYTNDIEKMRTYTIDSPYNAIYSANYTDTLDWDRYTASQSNSKSLLTVLTSLDWGWYAAPRPTAHSVKKYINFLNDNRQDINDYIFSLYEEYDHVILCERMHPEMTQYDMIYDLVTDSRFADKVGTVFTEIGNVDSRDAYRTLTDTSFPDSALFEQALSSFMMENQSFHLFWTNTNWFDFLKKIYYFNQGKEQKVDILFTDRANWVYKDQNYNRDKFMADQIISTIEKQNLNKSLTIMNYRHAYLVNDFLNDNCGYYMAKVFPGKVANVLVNTTAGQFMFLTPIQYGKWDVALEQMPEEGFAFHLSDSPFGKDWFDHFMFFSPLSKQTYEDIFTGMIYYKPFYKHSFGDGFPYMMQPTNKEILKERADRLNTFFHEDFYKPLHVRNSKFMYFIINIIDNYFFIWNLIIGFGMLLYLGIVYKKTK